MAVLSDQLTDACTKDLLPPYRPTFDRRLLVPPVHVPAPSSSAPINTPAAPAPQLSDYESRLTTKANEFGVSLQVARAIAAKLRTSIEAKGLVFANTVAQADAVILLAVATQFRLREAVEGMAHKRNLRKRTLSQVPGAEMTSDPKSDVAQHNKMLLLKRARFAAAKLRASATTTTTPTEDQAHELRILEKQQMAAAAATATPAAKTASATDDYAMSVLGIGLAPQKQTSSMLPPSTFLLPPSNFLLPPSNRAAAAAVAIQAPVLATNHVTINVQDVLAWAEGDPHTRKNHNLLYRWHVATHK